MLSCWSLFSCRLSPELLCPTACLQVAVHQHLLQIMIIIVIVIMIIMIIMIVVFKCDYYWYYQLVFVHSLYTVRPNITGIRSTVNGAVGPELNHEGILPLPEFTPQLELTCEAYGIPSPDVVWLHNGIALQNITGRRVITVEDGGSLGKLGNLTRSTLILSEVQLSDAGEYTCRATSGNVSPIPGTTAWTFTFQVTGESLMHYM